MRKPETMTTNIASGETNFTLRCTECGRLERFKVDSERRHELSAAVIAHRKCRCGGKFTGAL